MTFRIKGTLTSSLYANMALGDNGPLDKKVIPISDDAAMTPDRKTLCVLVVDDDLDFLESLRDLLELSDYEVCVAADIASAKDTARARAPDAALIDVKLGTENGLDLVPELKRIKPKVVCIVMTAYGDASYANRAFQSGADEFLFKPLETAGLFRILKDLLGAGENE